MTKYGGFIIFIIIILLFGSVAMWAVSEDNKIKEKRIKFCESYGMEFRSKDCGFSCVDFQCYGEKGAFEIGKKGEGFILIGYDANLQDGEQNE